MSKMGEQFEKNLDKYKYDLYWALKELVERDVYGSIRLPTQARDIMDKALAKVEGLDKAD